MKKAQIEMMGLVIVVIILIMGALLYLKFGILDQKKVQKESAVEVSYVINTLTALLNIKVCQAEPIVMEDLMQECIKQGNSCGTEACEYLKTETEVIMNAIGVSNKYKYTLYLEKDMDIIELKTECEYGTKADIKVVGTDREPYTVNMKIC